MMIGINTLFYIPGQVGGSETYLLEILRVWKRSEKDLEVVLFTNLENHEKLEEEFAGDGWICVRCSFRAENRVVRILREQIELPRRVRQSGVEVLWSPGYTSPFFCACPQVVSLLDMQYKRFPQDLSFIGRWTTEVLVQMAARRADHVLTISEFSKQEIQHFTPAPPERISVTPLAVDPSFTEPVPGDPGVPRPYILCVANSYPHKNVDQLIRAFVAVEDEIPYTLVWVGRPRLGEKKIVEALSRLSDPDRVVRMSGLSREELIRLFQQADLFVFPSLYEGFGLPVLESLTAGTPVLTTDCGSLPEVGGKHVSTYDPSEDENLQKALREFDPADEEWRTGLEEWMDAFSWKKTAQHTVTVLKECVKDGGTASEEQ
jgi:glycosyltransferase involved in cell wall biosynthesis